MKIISIIVGILVIGGGVSCFLTPAATFLSLAWIVGVMLIIAGISAIAAFFVARKSGGVTFWDLLSGFLTLLMGGFIITNAYMFLLTDLVLIYIFASWITATAFLRIAAAVQLKKMGENWFFAILAGILTLALGFYSFMHPVFTAITLGYLIGFWVIGQGVNMLFFGFGMGSGKKA